MSEGMCCWSWAVDGHHAPDCSLGDGYNYNTCRNCGEPIIYGDPGPDWHHEELQDCEEPELANERA